MRMRRVVEALDRLVGQVELVLDLADDLLDHVLERDDPLHVAVLVDDDRHVLARPPELGQERGDVLGLRDDVRRPQDLLDRDLGDATLVHRLQQVAQVQDADDVLGRLPVDREPRVRRVEHLAQALLRRHVRGDDDHLGPRHHHVGRLLVGEVEDLVEHLLLLFLELALDRRALEQQLQLGLRVDGAVAARRLEPEHVQRHLARALQEPDQRLAARRRTRARASRRAARSARSTAATLPSERARR